MIIGNLKLKKYRNYDDLDIDLDDKLNIFIGDNAQGKSNILESIYVLAVTKSYLGVKDKDLIKYGEDYGYLECLVCNNNYNYRLNVSLGINNKSVKINGSEIKKLVDYISKFHVILFSPDSIGMIKDSPTVRRRYLNIEISQISNNYAKMLQNYNFLLRQRNEFLKIIKINNKVDKDYLDVLDDKFSTLAVDIIFERFKFIEAINNYISNIYKEIMNVDDLIIKYITCLDYDSKNIMKDNFYNKLKNNFDKDKLYGMTLIGPHRDDFKFFIDNRELSLFASQGQLRGAVLALKLSEIDIFRKNTNNSPILLLDDIFSELDINKKNKLINYILDDVQTIITTTDLNMIDKCLVDRAKIFEISNGSVVNVIERNVIQNGK